MTAIRSEHCCLNLISNVLASCQMEAAAMESESETSSIEVLKTLTSHMTSAASPMHGKIENHEPEMAFFDKLVTQRSLAAGNKPNENIPTHSSEFLEQIIVNEENYFAFILLKCLQLCPSVFGKTIFFWQDFEVSRENSKTNRTILIFRVSPVSLSKKISKFKISRKKSQKKNENLDFEAKKKKNLDLFIKIENLLIRRSYHQVRSSEMGK